MRKFDESPIILERPNPLFEGFFFSNANVADCKYLCKIEPALSGAKLFFPTIQFFL
jgi:hypothetical protein